MLNPPDGFSQTPLLHRRGNLVIAHHDKRALLAAMAREEAEHTPPGATPLLEQSPDDAIERVPILDPQWVAGALYDADCWDIATPAAAPNRDQLAGRRLRCQRDARSE